MSSAPFDQLDIDDLQHIGKYMFSLANGNHILRYSEEEYRDYLIENPAAISRMILINNIAHNWGYDDERMFEYYDEQWLASVIDPEFQTELNFDLPDFNYLNLLPFQKAVIDFTEIMITTVSDWEFWFRSGSPLEMIYFVFANNLEVDKLTGEVLNVAHASARAMEMIRSISNPDYRPEESFASWELVIY